jgi:hypothetical protein
VDETLDSFSKLVASTECQDMIGLPLYQRLKAVLVPKLNFKMKQLFTNLDGRLAKANALIARLRVSGQAPEQKGFLVCGGGPVGFRTAVEAALLGFRVTVVEKRTTFSRANILTFWTETMDDMLGIGARIYCPNIVASGTTKHLGTREVQLVLLKTSLLLGVSVMYGHEVVGIKPPEDGTSTTWQGRFRPYISGRRNKNRELENEEAKDTLEAVEAEAALDFQKGKGYGYQKTDNRSIYLEKTEVDPSFISASVEDEAGEITVAFDTYVIAEGGWSDSTKKLGFNKTVNQRNPVLAMVINLAYNKDDPTEKKLQSYLKHALAKDFPLSNSRILSEFVEYLKGETHFIALVCTLEKPQGGYSMEEIDEKERSGELTADIARCLRDSASRMGLLEMGVLKQKLPKSQLLNSSNLDVGKLRDAARVIATDCGLPVTAEFFHTNPVQLFDFSSLARCEIPAKILGADGSVVDGTPENATKTGGPGSGLVFPVGDALQEPLWTSGLGVNRGFHGGLNAVFAALCAREKGVKCAMESIQASFRAIVHDISWGDGGLAGGGSGKSGIKNGSGWTADPADRLP